MVVNQNAAARMRAAEIAASSGATNRDIELPASLSSGARFGGGFNPTTGQHLLQCVEYGGNEALETEERGEGQAGVAVLNFLETESSSEIATHLKIDGKASAGFGPFSGGARYNMFHDATSTSFAYSAVAHATAERAPRSLKAWLCSATALVSESGLQKSTSDYHSHEMSEPRRCAALTRC